MLGFASYQCLRWAALPVQGLCTRGWSPGTQAHDSASTFTNQLIKGVYSPLSNTTWLLLSGYCHQSKELSRDFSHFESLRLWVTSSRLEVKFALPPRTRGFPGARSGQGYSYCITWEQATLVYREICKAITHAQRLTLRPKWKLKMLAPIRVGQKVWVFPHHLMEKPKWTFWPTQYFKHWFSSFF